MFDTGEDLSADQIRSLTPPAAPEWLEKSWDSAKDLGLDALPMGEIDTEIAAVRHARRPKPSPGQ